MFFGLMSLLIALEGAVDIVWSLGLGTVLVLVGAALLGSGRWLARGLRLTHHSRSRVLQVCGPRLRLHHADGRPFDLHAADLVSVALPRWGGRLILRDLGGVEHVLYVEGLSWAERAGLLAALQAWQAAHAEPDASPEQPPALKTLLSLQQECRKNSSI